jgi:beta-glucanase (GH16 family)
MPARKPLLVLLMLAALLVSGMGATIAPLRAAALPVVDDFEAPLAVGTDPNSIPVGWFNAQDGGSTVAFSRSTAAPERPGAPTPNGVLETTMNVTAYGVVIHGFENEAANAWVSQDWSSFLGFSFWIYGQGTGTDLFIDVIDNRSAGSTRDDGERYSVSFKDDVSGWRQLQFPFDSFARKEIGNGAPSAGFTLSEVHGWAFGALSTGGAPRTWYLDDVQVYGVAPIRPLSVGFGGNAVTASEGDSASFSVKLSKLSDAPVTVSYATADGLAIAGRDYLPASGTLTFAPGVREQNFSVSILDDAKWEGGETILLSLSDAVGAELGVARTGRIDIRENDAFDPDLIDDFEREPDLYSSVGGLGVRSLELAPGDAMALPDQSGYESVLTTSPSNQLFLPIVRTSGSSPAQAQQSPPAQDGTIQISRAFAASENWSGATGLSMWLYGRGSGTDLTLTLRDNRAPDPGPTGWKLLWSDEFNESVGTPPNPALWGYEIGDGSINSIPGWGNSELQYYSDSPENVAHDGQGNLAITVRDASESGLTCYYGPCEYTSARLLSQHKQEFGYGRIEARTKVPGGAGLWPAFWSLGADIAEVSWPQTGEIDIMEYVGRDPNTVFGTIHGPGYNGGNAYGDIYRFNESVTNEYHTYAIEWQPNLIVWYVDGIEYHRATPSDVAPNEWVFDHAFFLLLNIAVGGNFGGAVGPDTVFPATMQVDYVRVYSADDSAERFSASIKDDFTGWQKVTVPFSAFTRDGTQPSGAPNDGLTLSEVWGFDLTDRGGDAGPLFLDKLRLEGREPPKTQMTLPVTFDLPTVDYGLVGFGGAEDSSIVADPADAANKVAKVVKSGSAELWAGTTLTGDGTLGFASKIPFTAAATKMTVRVWSPDAGIKVRLKVEDAADGTKSVETEATTTVSNTWETLTFDFASQAAGTSALNLAYNYDKASIFFNFGTTGAVAGEKTYYFDDVAFGPTSGGGGNTWSPITFDDSALTYTLTGFGGADNSSVVADPTDATNQVAKVVKSGSAELWAGTTISTGPNFSVPTLPFSSTSTTMTVRVWSPDAGIKVRLKVEDAANGSISVETEATTTVAGAWETLTFNFANQATGTAALNLANTYNKVSIFFNFGVTGAVAGEKTYYFDDVAFGPTSGGGNTWSPITFDDSALTYTLTGFGGADNSTVVTDPTDAANQVAKVVKSGSAELWAGTTVSTGANFSVPTIPFAAGSTSMTVRVWSPDAGIKVRLKVEDAANGSISVETEATTTVAGAWETLTFNFANQATGTAALNLANTYNKASIFFNFGTTGAVAGEKTYYFDDVSFGP